VQSSPSPKGNLLHKNMSSKTRHMKYRSLRSVHPFFAQLTLLPNQQNPMLCNAFQLVRHHNSALPMGASTSHVMHVPWTHLTQHSKLHLDRFSRFSTAHGRESLYFTVCVKTRLKPWLDVQFIACNLLQGC